MDEADPVDLPRLIARIAVLGVMTYLVLALFDTQLRFFYQGF